MDTTNEGALVWSPKEVMEFCGLHPEFENSHQIHVLTLQKAGCLGYSFPSSGTVEEKY